jgi:hypothetical protein
MNIVKNDALIKRNGRIAQFALLAGLLVLAGGMFVSFRYPEQFAISLGALLAGFLLSQVGIYFSNRYGRSPRPDEVLNSALKGLSGQYTLYHYIAPVPHLLVGPNGVWILLPRYQRGKFSFSKGRYRQKGGNWYLKIFAQENLGRPDLEVMAEREAMDKFFQRNLPPEKQPPLLAALVFNNIKAEVEPIPEDSDAPAYLVGAKELKELVRRPLKGKTLSVARTKLIQAVIEGRVTPDLEAEADPGKKK